MAQSVALTPDGGRVRVRSWAGAVLTLVGIGFAIAGVVLAHVLLAMGGTLLLGLGLARLIDVATGLKAHRAGVAAEQRFELVARAASDGIYDWDIQSGHLWFNSGFYSGFGYAPGSIAEHIDSWDALLHAEDATRVADSLTAAIESSQEAWEQEYRFRRGDGTYAQVLDRGFLLRDADGTAVRMVGGMLDRTERLRDADDLRLLRRAVETTESGIVITDALQADMPMVYVNPAFTTITGYEASEALGRNCRLLQGDDVHQPGMAEIREALANESDVRVSVRNYRKDGAPFWNDLHLTPLRDSRGITTHFLGVITDVTERNRYEETLAYRATHDDLTGLPNRQLVLDRLGQSLRNAERHGCHVVVIFVDLDDFKLINDTLGHGAGDEVLRAVATRLQSTVRETDTVGRFGGDEFVIVLSEPVDTRQLHDLLERITAAVSAPMLLDGIRHTITPSIGYSASPEAGTTAEALLMRSDLAMYQAKRLGRNRVIAYHPSFDANVSQRLQLVSRLRDALDQEEFSLAFQPMFGPDGAPQALEALVRWQHPDLGELPPERFVGVCEESGLILELGRRVLMEAARHHALLVAVGLGHLRIAVNVSAAQFGDDLYEQVAEAVERFALPHGVLELELTESVIMDSPERAIQTMERLAGLGVCLAVDDFGTGYSSLTYLKRLPIRRLKIDRSFVRDLETDASDRSICESIIALAKALGLATVAEGVETQEQLAWLRRQGVDEVQGFLLARPQAFDDVVALLLQGSSQRGAHPSPRESTLAV